MATFLFQSWTLCSIKEVYGRGKQLPLFCCLPFLPLQKWGSDGPISDRSNCSFSLPARDISAHLGRGQKCRLLRPSDLERRSDHTKNTLRPLPHPPVQVPPRSAARHSRLPVTKNSAYFLSSMDWLMKYALWVCWTIHITDFGTGVAKIPSILRMHHKFGHQKSLSHRKFLVCRDPHHRSIKFLLLSDDLAKLRFCCSPERRDFRLIEHFSDKKLLRILYASYAGSLH